MAGPTTKIEFPSPMDLEATGGLLKDANCLAIDHEG